MDREKVIVEIAAALSILEKSSSQDIENAKKFLRWMSDDALLDMRNRHREALKRINYPRPKPEV